ncbi:MAG: hypothetical protein WCA29_13675 [Jiangellales bacterium]
MRPFAKTEVQRVQLELLISPLLTLTVLLLAFVLVQVFSSYKASREVCGVTGLVAEAQRIDQAGDTASDTEPGEERSDRVPADLGERTERTARMQEQAQASALARRRRSDRASRSWGGSRTGRTASARPPREQSRRQWP